MMSPKDIADLIFRERTRQGIARNRLATMAGVNRNTIYDIEMMVCEPKIKVILAIFDALKIEMVLKSGEISEI